MPSLPLVLGHRGASALAPENTHAAFARALEDGADGIEFDVRLSRDGVPVVIHDEDLFRTGLSKALVSELTVAELQKVDIGKWFATKQRKQTSASEEVQTVPTLSSVLETFSTNQVHLYVEMKCNQKEGSALAQAVAQCIHEAKTNANVVVESFELSAIADLKNLDANIRTSALFEPKQFYPFTILRRSRMIESALKHGADELALHHTLATPRIMDRAHGAGFPTVIWTVDDPKWIARAREIGIKALISNDPGQMVRSRDQTSR